MKILLFSKILKERDEEELVKLALECGIDGYDLCVRPGHFVNPDNVASKLIEVVCTFRKHNLLIPMITGDFDLLFPDHPAAEAILAAMDRADVRLIKLGYFPFEPLSQDYWECVDQIRGAFEGWQRLGNKHRVKVCYHTHSHRCMGLNCAMLAHLIRGFDPQYIGAYVDPGHLVIEGEEFAVGISMLKEYLSIVGLKDVLLHRTDRNGHGSASAKFVPAGKGMVDWTSTFSALKRVEFEGPLSVHCEFEIPKNRLVPVIQEEVSFFKRIRDTATA